MRHCNEGKFVYVNDGFFLLSFYLEIWMGGEWRSVWWVRNMYRKGEFLILRIL